jgi:hypothetical protein
MQRCNSEQFSTHWIARAKQAAPYQFLALFYRFGVLRATDLYQILLIVSGPVALNTSLQQTIVISLVQSVQQLEEHAVYRENQRGLGRGFATHSNLDRGV